MLRRRLKVLRWDLQCSLKRAVVNHNYHTLEHRGTLFISRQMHTNHTNTSQYHTQHSHTSHTHTHNTLIPTLHHTHHRHSTRLTDSQVPYTMQHTLLIPCPSTHLSTSHLSLKICSFSFPLYTTCENRCLPSLPPPNLPRLPNPSDNVSHVQALPLI